MTLHKLTFIGSADLYLLHSNNAQSTTLSFIFTFEKKKFYQGFPYDSKCISSKYEGRHVHELFLEYSKQEYLNLNYHVY